MIYKVIIAVYVCDYERILSFYHSIGSTSDSFVITNIHSNYHLIYHHRSRHISIAL